jgi:hypothetical protein
MLHFKSPILKLFPKDVEAVALFGHCFFRDSEQDTHPYLINHELIHCYQMKRDGMLRFYLTYFISYLKLRLKGHSHFGAYFSIPYEVEAYSNQTNLGYIDEQNKRQNS